MRLGIAQLPNPVGEQNPIFSSGWSATDATGFVWIEGAAGECVSDMPPALVDLVLEIDCFPLEPAAAAPQRLQVFVNGLLVGVRLLQKRSLLRFDIPKEWVTARKLRLTLVPSVVEVPKLSGRSPDERVLSIGVFSLRLANNI
jgi:hypothetical protein